MRVEYAFSKLPTLLALAGVASNPPVLPRVPLDAILVDDATALHGKLVRCTFQFTCPPDTHGGVTVVGTGWDAVERVAYLPKDLLLDEGDAVTAVGVLEVIRHRAAVVNTIFTPAVGGGPPVPVPAGSGSGVAW